MHEERIYQVALSMVPGIGDVTSKTLLSYCGSAKDIFNKSKSQLSKIPGIGDYYASKILAFNSFKSAEKEISRCEAHHINLLFCTDPNYPKKLKHAADSPNLLFYKGKGTLNNPKTVAIVGTRNATRYGKDFVGHIVEKLKQHNALIVSGLAYGIDIEAHMCALQNGLSTIGVMASGMDVIYPSMHKKTAKEMMENGGLITEFRMGTKPDAHNFPARNRIIAGMCDLTIVVEAAEKGGALITAEIANSYDRDVFALPGNIENRYSKGCNNLIKQNKAHLLTSISDIEYIMNWDKPNQSDAPNDKYYDYTQLSPEERVIIETLKPQVDGLILDELSWKSQIPLNKLAALLLTLEFNGIVKSMPGKKYRLK